MVVISVLFEFNDRRLYWGDFEPCNQNLNARRLVIFASGTTVLFAKNRLKFSVRHVIRIDCGIYSTIIALLLENQIDRYFDTRISDRLLYSTRWNQLRQDNESPGWKLRRNRFEADDSTTFWLHDHFDQSSIHILIYESRLTCKVNVPSEQHAMN
jgi:hypothetical protein